MGLFRLVRCGARQYNRDGRSLAARNREASRVPCISQQGSGLIVPGEKVVNHVKAKPHQTTENYGPLNPYRDSWALFDVPKKLSNNGS